MNPSPMPCSQVSPSPRALEAEEKGKVGALTFLRLGEGCPESVCVSSSLSVSLWVLDAKPTPVVKALATREGEGVYTN